MSISRSSQGQGQDQVMPMSRSRSLIKKKTQNGAIFFLDFKYINPDVKIIVRSLNSSKVMTKKCFK